jgi:hypothetical protein
LEEGGVDDSGVSGQAGVGLCAAARMLTRVTPTGVVGTFGVGPEPLGFAENAAHRPRRFRSPRHRRVGNERFGGEEQSFAACARPSCWLHKSVSGVRSRSATVVAAVEADGDLALGREPGAKRDRERSPGLAARREVKGPRRVACWLQTLGVVETGILHGVKAKAVLVGRWARQRPGLPPMTRASEVGPCDVCSV